MNDVVISARGLGKRYLIGHETVDRNQTFRERIMAGAGGLARNLAKTARGQQLIQGEVEEFWALKDVDFDIRRGDTVGIIGRNGAGKSTLLKILSRITEPTTGRVDIRGRVASLLEVGTGFHPELTGRENIFLNGAILGMSRAEIRRNLDEIVDFAGVEKFLDTPVKRYSSGMGVRLGFSVAAHLEPEILIVDEVLAVGDAEFQRKCLGRMGEVAKEGRTVLFVSHNVAAVRRLCGVGVLLSAGRISEIGRMDAILQAYSGKAAAVDAATQQDSRPGSGEARLTDIQLEGTQDDFPVDSEIEFRLTIRRDGGGIEFRPWALVRNFLGEDVLMLMPKPDDVITIDKTVKASIRFRNILSPGSYTVSCGILGDRGQIVDWLDNAVNFSVERVFESGRPFDGRLGAVTISDPWTSIAVSS